MDPVRDYKRRDNKILLSLQSGRQLDLNALYDHLHPINLSWRLDHGQMGKFAFLHEMTSKEIKNRPTFFIFH